MHAHTLRVGLDLDETITAAPRVFAALAEALLAAGHEVHIVTYRPDSTEERIAADLRSLGLSWTAIHHPPGFDSPPHEWKRATARTLTLDLLIDDDADVASAAAEVTTSLHLVTPAARG